MKDFFGIDYHECESAGLIGTPEFREYCRNHISQWRDERDYL